MTSPTDSQSTPGEDCQPRTQFDYLLNAADAAAHRIVNGNALSGEYRSKRLALFEYVRGLESSVNTMQRELAPSLDLNGDPYV